MTDRSSDLQKQTVDLLLLEIFGRARPGTRARAPKKSVVVYQILKRQIILGRLTCDSAITEQSLAQEFSCSQGTIREALMHLRNDGLVDRRGYQGTFITHTSLEEAIILARLRLTLECDSLGPVSLVRCKPETTARLRFLARAYLEARSQKDAYACSEIDRALHQTLFTLNNMPGLEPLLGRCLLLLHRFALIQLKGELPWSTLIEDPHGPILDALENAQVEETRERLRSHISRFLEQLVPNVHASMLPQQAALTV